jgi:hypothetical protein
MVPGACWSDEEEVVECCMLKQLASHCTPPKCVRIPLPGSPDCPRPDVSLEQRVADWQKVGESGDADSCRAMINSSDNGCSTSEGYYREADAVVDCQ